MNYDLLQDGAYQVIIDNQNGAVITGNLTVTVSPEQMIVGDGTVPVFYKEITSTVTWMEREGEQSFSLSKRITRL
jgi:hypothetical protein